MKKVLKVLRNILLGLLAILLIILAGVFIYNQVMLKKEEKYWKDPPGWMVEVDGHKMHVYTEGEGEHTIVLLTGFATTSPYLDFLPMCKDLASDNKVVIIERFGYGLSDVVGGERSFDTIVDQDREALEKLGIEGPYVLCPHSISGLESLIWAQKYPEEVEAIVGMDMSDTSIRDDDEMGDNVMQFVRALRATGFARFMFSYEADENSVAEAEMEYAILCRRLMNKTLINESHSIPESCDEISSKPLPKTPTLQFLAMQRHSAEEAEAWKASHQKIVDASSNGKLIELDCEHYVYLFEKDRIVQEIREFLKTL